MQSSSPSRDGVAIIRDYVKTLPQAPGVYRMVAEDGRVLYVGKARSLKKRVANYTQLARLPRRLQNMVMHTRQMEFITTQTEAEALLLEANLIKELKPQYNILLKDDKSYPYIQIDMRHPYPRITKFRGKKKKGAEYFGPYASAGAVNQSLNILQKAFLLRPCTDSYFNNRTRPCLQYQIKRCSAPCVNKISEEAYAQLIAQARDFLQGKSPQVQQDLSRKMDEASQAMDYEKAAQFRDRIRALSAVQSDQRLQFQHLDDADVIALAQDGPECCIQFFFYRGGQNYGNRAFFSSLPEGQTTSEQLALTLGQFYSRQPAPKSIYLNIAPHEMTLLAEALSLKEKTTIRLHVPQRGDKKEATLFAEKNAQHALARKQSEEATTMALLEAVGECFQLAKTPERVEVYDNSHIQGSHAIGAMIAAGPEGFIKNGYRKFTIRDAQSNDDFGMMHEVFTRRFSKLLKGDEREVWPDLILIDGGRGQLNAAKNALEALGLHEVPLVGVAKGPERNAGRETFYLPDQNPFTLPPHDPTLHYIQRLRDEAHRFVIGSHRAKRGKTMTRSALDDVPGIGPTRKKALLQHFGSARGVQDATLDDLCATPGIHAAMAKVIYDFFHEES
jgi:excinuclease ABC subunit C